MISLTQFLDSILIETFLPSFFSFLILMFFINPWPFPIAYLLKFWEKSQDAVLGPLLILHASFG